MHLKLDWTTLGWLDLTARADWGIDCRDADGILCPPGIGTSRQWRHSRWATGLQPSIFESRGMTLLLTPTFGAHFATSYHCIATLNILSNRLPLYCNKGLLYRLRYQRSAVQNAFALHETRSLKQQILFYKVCQNAVRASWISNFFLGLKLPSPC
jgi:hypothetical protein